VGALFGLFLAGYTGVLLSVSNQPIWSDTWALGGLFLASGLSVAAAAIALCRAFSPGRKKLGREARARVSGTSSSSSWHLLVGSF
jgi:formate-dependent nitrite reductase membrane component NrfD